MIQADLLDRERVEDGLAPQECAVIIIVLLANLAIALTRTPTRPNAQSFILGNRSSKTFLRHEQCEVDATIRSF
jgi:hypothetical protein